MNRPSTVTRTIALSARLNARANYDPGDSFKTSPVAFLAAYWDRNVSVRRARLGLPAPNQAAPRMEFARLPLVRGALLLFALGWLASPARAADAVLHPAYIRGTVHFANRTDDIVRRLSGARTLLFFGSSATPPLSIEAREDFPAGSLDSPYTLTVEGALRDAPAGYAYSLAIDLLTSQQYMLPSPAVTSPLIQDQTASPVDFNDTPGMLDIRFVGSPGGPPVSVDKASYFASDSGVDFHGIAGSHFHAIGNNGPDTTGYKLLVHSGTALLLQVSYSRGTDPTSDLINYYAAVNTTVGPDEVRVVEIVVPADTARGNITGIVHMLRETEEPTAPGTPAYALNTVMVADGAGAVGANDFWDRDRYEFLNGTPASGFYALTNLLASEDFEPSLGTAPYRVYGRMQFRTGHARNCFRTPSFLEALVPRGATNDLGDMFVMDPGYVGGQIVLQGPRESGGVRSPLRYVRTASDMGSGAWATECYTSVEGDGKNQVAAGATESTYEGVGLAEIDGSFDGISRFIGNYSLVLGGLKSQAGIWDLSKFNLYFNSGGTGDPFVLGKLLITDLRPSQVTVHPSEHITRDLRLCFGTLTVNFTAPAGATFLRPAVSVRGHFAGPDDLGNPVDYDVETGAGMDWGNHVPLPFVGELTTPSTGTVRLALPRGEYTLTPSVQVVAADGSVSTLTLPAITYTACCTCDGLIDPCLQVNLSPPPACASAPSVRITGSVTSCTNVAKIVWDKGDNIEHVICEGCGISPSFAFDFPVSGPCQDYSLKVTAYDLANPPAWQTLVIPADRTPPTITCPTNMTINCASPNGAKVDYPAPVVADNCDSSPTVTCAPASGSWFLPGDTAVTCTATDRCGNSNSCTFTVTVTTNCPPPQCLDLHCWTNTTAYACGSNCVPVYYYPWAQNLCDPKDISVLVSPPSGTCFSLGDYTVDVWASGSGQTNHCSFTVSVLPDPACPTNQPCLDLHCPTNVTAYVCGSNCVSVPFNVWATDRCSSNQVTVVTDLPSGYCFHLGTTWVNATASGSGQTVQCSFPVTVLPDPNCQPPPGCTNCSGGCGTNNLLVNGSFEWPSLPDGYAALPGMDNTILGWVTLLNGVQYYNPRVAPLLVNTGVAADGLYLVDLAPANGIGGGIQQTFATVAGHSYHVSFAMGTSKERGRSGSASLTVTVAGHAYAFNVSTESSTIVWERKEFNFVAPSTSATLVFSTMDDPALSFVDLDNVCVSDHCTDSGLTIRRTVTVEWKCGILQSAPAVTGPYTDVTGATSPYTVDATDPQRYFRTR